MDEQQRRAPKLQPWPRGAHHLRALDRIEHEQREDERRHVARPDHLHGIHVAVEEFRRRVAEANSSTAPHISAMPVSLSLLRLLGRSIRRPPAGDVEHRAGRERVVRRRAPGGERGDLLDLDETARGIFDSM